MRFYVSSCVAHSTAMRGIQGNRPSGGGRVGGAASYGLKPLSRVWALQPTRGVGLVTGTYMRLVPQTLVMSPLGWAECLKSICGWVCGGPGGPGDPSETLSKLSAANETPNNKRLGKQLNDVGLRSMELIGAVRSICFPGSPVCFHLYVARHETLGIRSITLAGGSAAVYSFFSHM